MSLSLIVDFSLIFAIVSFIKSLNLTVSPLLVLNGLLSFPFIVPKGQCSATCFSFKSPIFLQAKNTYDAIIVDPPRSGLDKKTKATLLQIKSPKLIYISCNPITLTRDLNDLKEIYDIKDITLFDMFPNTYHVESVVLMERKTY